MWWDSNQRFVAALQMCLIKIFRIGRDYGFEKYSDFGRQLDSYVPKSDRIQLPIEIISNDSKIFMNTWTQTVHSQEIQLQNHLLHYLQRPHFRRLSSSFLHSHCYKSGIFFAARATAHKFSGTRARVKNSSPPQPPWMRQTGVRKVFHLLRQQKLVGGGDPPPGGKGGG